VSDLEPVVPATAPAPATVPVPVPAATLAPRRKRRGWIVALVVLGVLGVLTVVAFLVVDAIAKNYARDYVRERIVQVLALPADADVQVDLGGGSIILQALAGRISTVDVSVPEVSFGALVGSADLHAEGVPLDEAGAVERLRLEFRIDESDVSALAGNLSGLERSSVTLDEPEIVVTSMFSLLGIEIPIGMGILPSAAQGDLIFTPTRVTLAGEDYTAAQLQGNPLFGALAAPLLQQQSICLADRLPAAFTLSDAAVDGEVLRLTIRGDGAALGGGGLSAPGVCAG